VPQQTTAVLAILVALIAAIRSAWSPCSLSMLSSLTPFGEASRGNRYAVAATAFIGSALLGGLCLGLALSVPALAIDAFGVTPATASAVVAIAAGVTVAADFGVVKTPRIPRQVDESWFGQFRPWVYGLGYGWQIGVGLATYVMTNAVYLMLVVAAMTGDPWVAICIGAIFGGVRGLTLLVGWRLVDPGRIRNLHRRLDALEPTSRLLAVGAQVVILSVAASHLGSVGVGLVAAVVVAAIALTAALRAQRRRRGHAAQATQCSTGSPADARWRSTRSASSSTTSAAVASPHVRSQFANIR
jgi:hypothetical protein